MTRFGTLSRMTYFVSDADADALRSGEIDPAHAYVTASGVPEPTSPDGGQIVAVEWRLDLDPPVALVTFWTPRY